MTIKGIRLNYKPVVLFFDESEEVRQVLTSRFGIYLEADPTAYEAVLEKYSQTPVLDEDGNCTNPLYTGAEEFVVEI
jgi:hypothetical protein